MLRSFVVNKMAGIRAGRPGIRVFPFFSFKKRGPAAAGSLEPSPGSNFRCLSKRKRKDKERITSSAPCFPAGKTYLKRAVGGVVNLTSLFICTTQKAAQRVRLFAWGEYGSFIMAVKGSGRPCLHTFESTPCFPAGKTYLKRAVGGVVMLIWP